MSTVLVKAFFTALTLHVAPSHALQVVQHQKTTSYKQEMTNHEDMFYTGTITLGGQDIDAILDTGSFDLVVMSTRCKTCDLRGTAVYDTNSSSAYNEGDLIMVESYGSGDLMCQSAKDTLTIGELSQIDGQHVWEAVWSDLEMTGELGFDVILGIGPPNGEDDEIDIMATYAGEWASQFESLGLTVPENYSSELFKDQMRNFSTVLENLDTRMFSVVLGRESGSPGYLVWNDNAATEQADLFQKVNVLGERTWTTAMGSALFKGGAGEYQRHIGCDDGCGALFDSGTSLIMAPSETYNKIYDFLVEIEASCDDMDALPDLEIKVQGVEFTLPPSSYIGYVDEYSLAHGQYKKHFSFNKAKFGKQDGMQCTLLVGEMDEDTQFGPMWILGDPFFREYYTTFELGSDMKSSSDRYLHMSPSSDDCEPSSLQLAGQKRRSSTPMKVDASKIRVPKFVTEKKHGKKTLRM